MHSSLCALLMIRRGLGVAVLSLSLFSILLFSGSVFGAVLEYQPVTLLSPALLMGNMVEIV